MSRSKIEQLFVNDRAPMNKRYSWALRKRYEVDLKRVIELESKGHVAPSAETLAEYFESEYSIMVGGATVRRHLTVLRRKKFLWRK